MEYIFNTIEEAKKSFYKAKDPGDVFICSDEVFEWMLNQPERSKREDKSFVIKGSNDCIALDAIPSEECKEYHKNSCIQLNYDGKSYLMRCSEQSGN